MFSFLIIYFIIYNYTIALNRSHTYLKNMAKVKITVDGYKCERCEYEWIARKKAYPRVCPRCKSPYWDIPKKVRDKK